MFGPKVTDKVAPVVAKIWDIVWQHSHHTFDTVAPSFVSLGINTLDNQGNHTHSHAFLTLKSLCFDDLALATTMRPYLLKFKHFKNIRQCFHKFYVPWTQIVKSYFSGAIKLLMKHWNY